VGLAAAVPGEFSWLILSVSSFACGSLKRPCSPTRWSRAADRAQPGHEALKRHPRNFMVVLGARLAETGSGYLFPVFGLSYVINTLACRRPMR